MVWFGSQNIGTDFGLVPLPAQTKLHDTPIEHNFMQYRVPVISG